jgi:hypothetical protein
MTPVDLYKRVLPRTDCKDCGYPTCMAFSFAVVQEQKPLDLCPHIEPAALQATRAELEGQHQGGKYLRRSQVDDALAWARQRAASMEIADLPARIGGELKGGDEGRYLALPYFTGAIHVRADGLFHPDGEPLGHWEQVFVYNHMAQGGSAEPTGRWKGLEEIPNTVSKQKSMQAHVEGPLASRFAGREGDLRARALALGGIERPGETESADLAVRFQPLPRIPILLLFWDAEPDEGFDARVKLLFDETIVEHLDIESIMFLCENLRDRLREDDE